MIIGKNVSVFIGFAVAFILSYLMGSINSAIIASKIMLHDDIRNYGSGNAGATNALRTLGKKGAAFVVVGDLLKAVIAVGLTKLLTDSQIAVYISGIGVVLGHNFPIYFGFRGGKGIIVSLVAILFADWHIGLTAAVIAILIMAVSKYVSLGSISGAVIFLVLGLIFRRGDLPFCIFAVAVSALAVIRHSSNIKRLLNGTENKLGAKKQ